MYKNVAGFSLMEALVTVLVLNVGLLGLGQLQARLWAAAGDLRALGDAYLLGGNLLEIRPLTWLPVDTAQNLARQSEPAIRATLAQLEPTRINSPLVTTEVRLLWRRPSGEQSLSLAATVNNAVAAGDTRWLLPWK